MLTLDDGSELFQTASIMRYLGKTLRNGEMYPANKDPMVSYKIELIYSKNDELMGQFNAFILPIHPGYKDKDTHFVTFITEHFPKYLEYFEGYLNKSSGKYMLGDELTIADFNSFGCFFKLALNDLYEHNLILKTMISKYPKTLAYINDIEG